MRVDFISWHHIIIQYLPSLGTGCPSRNMPDLDHCLVMALSEAGSSMHHTVPTVSACFQQRLEDDRQLEYARADATGNATTSSSEVEFPLLLTGSDNPGGMLLSL